jgi:hypothetical protein
MLESHGGQTPNGGNYGWLAAAVTGAIAGAQAWFHKRRRPTRPVSKIPISRREEEYLERLELVEASTTQLRRDFTEIHETLLSIQRRVVMKQDLVDFENRLKRVLGAEGD